MIFMNIFTISEENAQSEYDASIIQRPKKTYVPPAIEYIEEMEVIASSCGKMEVLVCGENTIN